MVRKRDFTVTNGGIPGQSKREHGNTAQAKRHGSIPRRRQAFPRRLVNEFPGRYHLQLVREVLLLALALVGAGFPGHRP